MKHILTILFSIGMSVAAHAQQYVVDPWQFAAVTENSVARSAAESTHDQYLSTINTNLNDLNTNVGSVVLAQTMIYQALSNVNSALKNGLEVKNMAVIVADMTGYINQALTMAKSEPYLLLFANGISNEMKSRALALVSEVSGFVLKEGNNILADYNSRDELLRKVTMQLQILNGLAYGTWKAMFWAKQRGLIAAINPFAGFINTDKIIVERIIQNARFLRQ